MAREATPVFTPYRSEMYTVANATAISKGTLLKLTDPFTAAAQDAAQAVVGTPSAGIAAADKEANDGSTTLNVWKSGRFEATASGAIVCGASICFINDNYVAQVSGITCYASGAYIVGYALETASTGEQINIQLTLA